MTEEMKNKERVSLDMPCRCSPEGVEDANALRAEVNTKLEEWTGHPEFVSKVVASLNWTYDTYITMVAMDLWFGVQAENSDEVIFVPCDLVEDGFAAIWKYLHDKRSSNEETSSSTTL